MTGILSRLSRALSGRPRPEGDDRDWAPEPRQATTESATSAEQAQQEAQAGTGVLDRVVVAAAEVARVRGSRGAELHARASVLEEQLVCLAARLQHRIAAGLEVAGEETLAGELLDEATQLTAEVPTGEPAAEEHSVA